MSFEIKRPIFGDINGAAAYNVPNITFVKVPYNGAPVLDGGMQWDAATFEFIVPETGIYQVVGWMTLDLAQLLPGDVPGQSCVEHLMAVSVNGIISRYIGNHMVPVDPALVTGTASWLHGSAFLRLTAGTRVALHHWQHGNAVWPAYVGGNSHYFQIIHHTHF